MEIVKRCYHCNIVLTPGTPVYSACDTIQCSYECMIERYKKVQTIDPELRCPSSWSSISDTSAMQINKRISPMKKTRSCIWIDINRENTMYPNTDIVIENKEIKCCYKLRDYIRNIMCIISICCIIISLML
jgi:hypothetical protein